MLSPRGKTTYQVTAIRVGWHIKVEYERNAMGLELAPWIDDRPDLGCPGRSYRIMGRVRREACMYQLVPDGMGPGVK